jgi:hypothetical protein
VILFEFFTEKREKEKEGNFSQEEQEIGSMA